MKNKILNFEAFNFSKIFFNLQKFENITLNFEKNKYKNEKGTYKLKN